MVNISGTGTFPLVCGGTEMTLNGNPTGGSGSYVTHSWTGDVNPLSSFNTEETKFKTIINGTYNITYTVPIIKPVKQASRLSLPMICANTPVYFKCGTVLRICNY
ncbi:MAG: hypothetical protein H6540_04405 [Bacteroidales bacterium]|nr:hypothetical protein [Bacteroidales bacterium]